MNRPLTPPPPTFIFNGCVRNLTSPMDTICAQRCPSCDTESMLTTQNEYEVEHFGAILISLAGCRKCGYKHTDVITLTEREPIALTARVNSLADLNMRVIKSGTATVTIPEFGAKIAPGPYSDGYITNVEGLLTKIEDALAFMLSTAKGKRLRKGERMLKQMRCARDSIPHFTLMIRDPFGNSAIVSPKPGKVKKRKLTKRELLTVKYGQHAIAQASTALKS